MINVNDEPETPIRPLELESMSGGIAALPNAPQVTKRGQGRGTSRQSMGLSDKADCYVTSDPIRTTREALHLYGLEWTVSKRPLFAGTGEEGIVLPVKQHSAIVRDDTDEVLGVVGSRYSPIQNDVLEILDAITDEAPIVRGGVWDGGRRVWLQTEVTEFDTPSGPCKGNGLAATSHDGSLAITFTTLGNVVACRNTFARNLASSPNKWTIRHTAKAADMIEALKARLVDSRAYFKELQKEFHRWGSKHVGESEFNRLTDLLAPKPEVLEGKVKTAYDEKIHAIRHAYREGPGALPGTAWGLAMAGTYYQEHMRSIRSGTDRFERALNDGTTQQALQLVSVIAGER